MSLGFKAHVSCGSRDRGFVQARKVRRDGEQLYEYARWVIVLDANGTIVEQIDRRSGSMIDCIAVLGPVWYRDTLIPQSVLLEVGLSRAVPYGTTEHLQAATDMVLVSKGRKPVARLPSENLIRLMPSIASALRKITGQRVAEWKVQSKFLPSLGQYKRRGIFVTIPEEELALCYAVFERDLLTREYLREEAERFNRIIKKYLLYKRQRDRDRLGTTIAGILWACRNRDQHYFDFVCSNISEANLVALEEILKTYGKRYWDKAFQVDETMQGIMHPRPAPTLYCKAVEAWGARKQELLRAWNLPCIIHEGRNTRRLHHAKGFLRFEVIPDTIDIVNNKELDL